jgi:flagellar hook-basal body complex protein FliE
MSPLLPVGAVPVEQLQGLFPADEVPPAPAAAPHAAGTFGKMVSEGLAHVNDQLLASQTGLQRLAVGDVQSLHQIMIQLEESRLSFQFMLQVRGRLLEAYQDVMKMQI